MRGEPVSVYKLYVVCLRWRASEKWAEPEVKEFGFATAGEAEAFKAGVALAHSGPDPHISRVWAGVELFTSPREAEAFVSGYRQAAERNK